MQVRTNLSKKRNTPDWDLKDWMNISIHKLKNSHNVTNKTIYGKEHAGVNVCKDSENLNKEPASEHWTCYFFKSFSKCTGEEITCLLIISTLKPKSA